MTTFTMTQEKLESIILEAKQAAKQATEEYIANQLGGVDQFACGFGWTIISEFEGKRIKGNTKIGRLLKKCGIDQNWQRQFEIWNPSGTYFQNVDCKEIGAQAAAEVFRKHGFKAYANSRLD